MSTLVESQESRVAWILPAVKPLDESVWQAWLAKGRVQERRRGASRVTVAKWISAAVLLISVGAWSQLAPYEVLVKFLVTLGAITVMLQAFHARHYAVAALFAGVAVLYNPAAPVFSLSGDWQHAVVAATVFPFVASLASRNARTEIND
jgi:hypothetical protein